MNMIRRINLYGSSGSGKSTVAAELYARLKRRRMNVELVRETAKIWAYKGIPIRDELQIQVAKEQLQLEQDYLQNGVDLIVTDCPPYLNAYYADKYKTGNYQDILLAAEEHEKIYPSINIFLEMTNREFDGRGRFENQDESRYNQLQLKEFLFYRCCVLYSNMDKLDEIEQYVLNTMKESI